MNFHTILHRELLIASKRRSTFYSRSAVAFVAISITVGIAHATLRGLVPVTMTGRNLLWTLGFLSMAFAAFEGFSQALDCISRERREGTLGLLFLSNLRAHDVIVGKTAAAGLRAFYALIAAAPAPAITFLFGGVTLPDYLRVIAAVVNALFFSLALGILVSALPLSKTRAVGLASALGLWFIFIAPTIGAGLYARGSTLAAIIAGASPTLPLLFLFDDSAGAAAFFGGALISSNICAWLLFSAAAWRLNATWQVAEPLAPSTAPVRTERPSAEAAARRRQRPLAAFWTATVLTSLLWAGIWIFAPKAANPIVFAATLLILHSILSFDAAALASRAMAEFRASGSLESFLRPLCLNPSLLRASCSPANVLSSCP
jgi:hypothetical protein